MSRRPSPHVARRFSLRAPRSARHGGYGLGGPPERGPSVADHVACAIKKRWSAGLCAATSFRCARTRVRPSSESVPIRRRNCMCEEIVLLSGGQTLHRSPERPCPRRMLAAVGDCRRIAPWSSARLSEFVVRVPGDEQEDLQQAEIRWPFPRDASQSNLASPGPTGRSVPIASPPDGLLHGPCRYRTCEGF